MSMYKPIFFSQFVPSDSHAGGIDLIGVGCRELMRFARSYPNYELIRQIINLEIDEQIDIITFSIKVALKEQIFSSI